MSGILENLGSTAELKRLSIAELETLAGELRQTIIDTVARTGGHLASSLGVVELTLALHRVFDSPRDRIVWDVGHQAYAHKLLTGRRERFPTLRQLGGVSGFPKRLESEHDCFDVGHSSTSISAALGMAAARDTLGGEEKIVAVIGDGSLTAGLAFEGLNQAGHLKRDLIVILNDNEMSISPNVGALASFLSRAMTSDLFVRFRKETENLLSNVPRFGRDLVHLARRAEDSIKGFFTPGMLFEAFGFDYVGPLNGHRLEELIHTLQNVSRLKRPILVHVITRKGKGYAPAEKDPPRYHGVGPFDPATGEVLGGKGEAASYTAIFGRTLVEMAERDPRVVAITAAMLEGTGLKEFADRFPQRFYDVGIAEQHAVTFAAGLACRGLRPVVTVYSTFLQRAYDNVLHDVCLQNLPVTFAMDRGGLVGADGPTHHGVFDYSYLRHIPNLTFMAPRDENELRRAMVTALGAAGPFAYRYPRGNGIGVPLEENPQPLAIGRGEKLRDGRHGVIFAAGTTAAAALQAAEILEAEGLSMAVVDPRFLKPLDSDLLTGEARRTGLVVTVEENVLAGGFGSAVLELLAAADLAVPCLRLGLPDAFVEQGSQTQLRAMYGLDAAGIARQVREFMAGHRAADPRPGRPVRLIARPVSRVLKFCPRRGAAGRKPPLAVFDGNHIPGNSAPRLRLPGVSSPPGGGCRRPPAGGGRVCADAHRWRQVPLLSDTGPAAAGNRHRRLPADFPDAGPGGRPARQWRAGGLLQFHPGRRRFAPGAGRSARRSPRPALRRPGAADERRLPGASAGGADRPARHRRSALRLAMGARFPPRVPGTRPAAPALPGGAADRPDRHRRPADPARYPRAPRADAGRLLRGGLRSSQHPLYGGRKAEAAAAADDFPASPEGGSRHRLCPEPPAGRGGGGPPGRRRPGRRPLPCRTGRW